MEKKILIFIEEGIGNIIQAMPTVIAINSLGYKVDIALRSNFPGVKKILMIPEVNRVFNIYVERIPEPKSYERVILSMFGHLDHYKFWKEDFQGVEIVQDSEIAKDLGQMNDVEINMRFARDLGYEGPIPDVKLNYPDNSTFQYFDNIICAGSGSYNKRWPYFMDLAKKLKGRVGIVGGPREEGESVNWPPNCVDMSGVLELDEIAAIISKAGVYIGNDSGITHLANATGTPCVVIWGPTNLVKCKPWNNPVAIVSKGYECQPCILIQSETKCEKKGIGRSCLIDITVDEVIEAVDKIKECITYKSESDYISYWDSYNKLGGDDYHKEIIPYLDSVLKELKLSGEKCIDFGCSKGGFIPLLNLCYKNIDAIDITNVTVPKLNGVKYINSKNDEYEKKTDLLFISNTLSWLKPINNYPTDIDFESIIIIDKMDDGKESKNKKQIPLKKEELEKAFSVVLEEKSTIDISNGDKLTILYGKKIKSGE